MNLNCRRNTPFRAGSLAVLLLTLSAACLSVGLHAQEGGEAPPAVPEKGQDPDEKLPPPTEGGSLEGLPDIDWSAIKQSFVEEKGAIILSGSAWVRYMGVKLEADNIVFFRQTKEVYAEGNIRLRAGESELSAEVAYIDITRDSGYLIDAVVRVSAPPDLLAKRKGDEPRLLGEAGTIKNRDIAGVYVDVADDPQARTNIIFRAQKVVKHGALRFSAEDAFITTDDMAHPMYGVKVGALDFYMKEIPNTRKPGETQLKPHKVIAKRARIDVLGVSSFPFPTVTYDLMKKNTFFSVNAGSSQRWGYFALSRFGYGLTSRENRSFDPTHVYLDLDERLKRGPAVGFEVDWLTGKRPKVEGRDFRFERGSGHIRVYGTEEIQISNEDDIERARRDLERRIQPKVDGFPRRQYDSNLLFAKRRRADDTGPPSFDAERHGDEFRGLIDFAHHQPFRRFAGIDNIELDFIYERHSDRDFMLEYFQNNYLQRNEPEALASARKAGDNYSVELLYRGNPQDFYSAPPRDPLNYGTFTSYTPALTYSLTPTPLKYGVYLNGETQIARMRKDFDRAIYDNDGFEATRGYTKFDLSRPVRMGPVNVVPHLGAQGAAYDNSLQGDGRTQGAVTYGLDMTSRIYGTFEDLENDSLALEGFRHIIEPRFVYRGISDTLQEPEELYDFDEVDDLQSVDRITLAFDQTFQTRRRDEDGNRRTVNFAGFDMAVDYYPRERDQQRLLSGNSTDLFRMNGFLRVVDAVKVDGALGFRLNDFELETAAYGITIDPGTRWRVRLEERFNFNDNRRAIVGSDQFRVRLEYQLSERWGFAFEQIYEQKRSLTQRKGRQVERISLTRDYGPLAATFSYALDRNIGENSFYVTVRPQATYRNLVVSKSDVLAGAEGIKGDADEAREENNFDPFELMKKRKKKDQQERERRRSAPPPPPPDAPEETPAPAPSSKGTLPEPKPATTSRTPRRGSFEDPEAEPVRAQTRKVDEDDWTAPPPTPATAR